MVCGGCTYNCEWNISTTKSDYDNGIIFWHTSVADLLTYFRAVLRIRCVYTGSLFFSFRVFLPGQFLLLTRLLEKRVWDSGSYIRDLDSVKWVIRIQIQESQNILRNSKKEGIFIFWRAGGISWSVKVLSVGFFDPPKFFTFLVIKTLRSAKVWARIRNSNYYQARSCSLLRIRSRDLVLFDPWIREGFFLIPAP